MFWNSNSNLLLHPREKTVIIKETFYGAIVPYIKNKNKMNIGKSFFNKHSPESSKLHKIFNGTF